jgi:ribosome maturation protein Sdo1
MHEWAKAYRNLEMAKQHIERARLKMVFRKNKFKAKNYEFAEILCTDMLQKIETMQKILIYLIDKYGIKVNGQYSKTLLKYLQSPKMVSAEEWANKNKIKHE